MQQNLVLNLAEKYLVELLSWELGEFHPVVRQRARWDLWMPRHLAKPHLNYRLNHLADYFESKSPILLEWKLDLVGIAQTFLRRASHLRRSLLVVTPNFLFPSCPLPA